ncbi:MAG: hypothetical protein EOO73_11595 [Myxococcales bacterium]|nr:MAG: hypothetical protein EOO73_11595 [Myxococcales bacterium]
MTKPDLDYLVRLARRERAPAAPLEAIARQLRVPFVAAPVTAFVLPSSAFAAVMAKLEMSRLGLVGWGAGSALAVAGGALALTLAGSPPSESDASAVRAPVVVKTPAPVPIASALPAPEAEPEPAPEARSLPAVPERQKPRESPTAWDEPQLIERARKALVTDPKRALTLTQEYQRRYPNGALRVEREVIALEALARTGQLAEARRLALAFQAKHPTSIHLPRVRSLLAKLGSP